MKSDKIANKGNLITIYSVSQSNYAEVSNM